MATQPVIGRPPEPSPCNIRPPLASNFPRHTPSPGLTHSPASSTVFSELLFDNSSKMQGTSKVKQWLRDIYRVQHPQVCLHKQPCQSTKKLIPLIHLQSPQPCHSFQAPYLTASRPSPIPSRKLGRLFQKPFRNPQSLPRHREL